MWPLSQEFRLSLDGQLPEFSNLIEAKFRHLRFSKTKLAKLNKQDTVILLKFERSQARSIYAESELRASQANKNIILEGYCRIPLGNFLLHLYFPVVFLFLMRLFNNVHFLLALFGIGFLSSIFFIALLFSNLNAMQKELKADFTKLY